MCSILSMLEGSGRQDQSYFSVWKVLGGSMCRILRVWKLKTLINISYLFGLWMESSGRQNQLYFTCLEGSGRLNVSYCTRLEAQNVDKCFKFARFWEAQGGSEHGGPVESIRNLGSPRYLGT